MSDFTIIADKNIESIPTKECGRCKKLGRPFVHTEDKFSLKKDGKRHTYCKACRAEQTKDWNSDAETKERRAQYQRDYRAARRQKVYHGNVYKRRANKPTLPTVLGKSFENAVEVQIENGELVPVAKFDHLYFAFNCEAVQISARHVWNKKD